MSNGYRGFDFDAKERSFNRMVKVFWVFFGIVCVGIMCAWVTVGYTTYQVATHPEKAGVFVGQVVKGFVDEVKK